MNLSEHYDKRYSENPNPFGDQASGELVCGLRYITAGGKALDIGCGTGRNTAYLAVSGFEVEAVDLSQVAVTKLLEATKQYPNLKVSARVADIVEEGIHDIYKVVVCAQVLHHIERNKGLELVKSMQEHTEPGGLNAIGAFTKDGDFFKSKPQTDRLYLDHLELLRLYDGWEVKYYTEQERPAFVGGSNLTAFIAAIKPIQSTS